MPEPYSIFCTSSVSTSTYVIHLPAHTQHDTEVHRSDSEQWQEETDEQYVHIQINSKSSNRLWEKANELCFCSCMMRYPYQPLWTAVWWGRFQRSSSPPHPSPGCHHVSPEKERKQLITATSLFTWMSSCFIWDWENTHFVTGRLSPGPCYTSPVIWKNNS